MPERPTKGLFKEWLKSETPSSEGVYSISKFYAFLGGRKVQLKNNELSQLYIKWLKFYWYPFYKREVRPNLNEFKIGSVIVGSYGIPNRFILE